MGWVPLMTPKLFPFGFPRRKDENLGDKDYVLWISHFNFKLIGRVPRMFGCQTGEAVASRYRFGLLLLRCYIGVREAWTEFILLLEGVIVLPILVRSVRGLGRQLLESIAYIHDLHIIHTDLKPENILLASYEDIKIPDYKKHSQDGMHCLPKSSAIKLIDFGSTASGSQNHRYLITARHYRAPEVILGIGWSYPSDLWSVGCILTELFSGKTLFRPRESFEHLAIMERVSGPFPVHMIQKSNWNAEKYFKGGVKLNWPGGTISKESITSVNNLNCLRALVPRNANSSKKSLGDLLHGLLKLDPSERLTARQALNLPFFKNPT
ncbi:hypothetical protein HHK36_033166 [Tetracentron sinense]|uniref:Protein kinase domain-containing protein n=1 Tax=Tetracentron sinense TaxID=13715 RepID=A0A834Y7Z7_TETSI|nr:hypothetical protein HHK36_033166 [Tetracentron sinense]